MVKTNLYKMVRKGKWEILCDKLHGFV